MKCLENSRVIGLGRCMEKMVGEITKKVGDITEKVGVYTANLELMCMHWCCRSNYMMFLAFMCARVTLMTNGLLMLAMRPLWAVIGPVLQLLLR